MMTVSYDSIVIQICRSAIAAGTPIHRSLLGSYPHDLMCRSGCSIRSKQEAAWPDWNAWRTARSAAGAVGAADRTGSDAEQRARTTAIASVAAAQNGTSGALAICYHARRWPA